DQELIKSGYKNQIAAGVVLTGGTSLIHGMQDLAEQVFDLPVRIGYPEYVGGLYDMVNNPKYATAVGLLLYGAEKRQTAPAGGGDFRIREDNVFNRILGRMKKWFVDIA
ncbi:MAG TPA: cell division FtsA domain-containing protein, partial [Humidesulfovibrio sp.]|uniref:cell division FtsA domain-containing protein n=1 Tax=Humidesulfovibrio sp. TaxID=2910988 RepID=UPI002CC6AC60